MSKFTAKIESVLNGISPLQYFGQDGSYHAGIAIDPDLPISDSEVRLSGFIRPTAMEKFSASVLNAPLMFFTTNPKDALCYAYDNSGYVYSINSSYTMTALNSGSALTSASGNGSEYNDNYAYFAKNTDICRYGPLNGSPSFNESYWTSTLSKTALSNTTYPSINGVMMPNHVMHRHTDSKMYICDVLASNKGALHYVSTTKASVEGDTDNGSSYNALDFDYGYYPVSVETYGTDLAVALIEGIQTGIKQKPAAVSFWDTTAASFSKLIQVEFPDPIISAMKNVNGVLYVWSGNVNGGVRLSRFLGGYSFEEVWFSEDGYPPLQGAVDAELNRVIWGTPITYPETATCVFAMGSRSFKVGQGIHNILKTTADGSSNGVTALKYFKTTANNLRQPIVAWKVTGSQGVDKTSTTYGVSVYRSEVFRLGKPYQIGKIRIPLAQAVATNQTAEIRVYKDNGSSSDLVATINSTNYPNSERNVVIYPSVNGYHDFFLEIRTSGTALLTAALPITIEGETKED